MSRKSNMSSPNTMSPAREQNVGGAKVQTPRTEEEKRVWDALEEARQKVAPVVKREVEGAQVDSDLLNLRLRSRS